MEKNDWTARAQAAVRGADEVLVRTALTRSAETLSEAGIAFTALDFIYEKSRNFDTLKKNLAAEVVRRAEGKNLVYCVDGGVCEDASAKLLLSRKDVAVIEGVTKGAYAAAAAGVSCAFQSVSAYEAAGRKLTLPLVIYDLDSRDLASDVKLLLCDKFGDEAPATFLSGGRKKRIALYEADRQETYDSTSMLVVDEIPLLEKTRFDFDDFLAVMRRLRAPDGCPWDRVQTHESIRLNGVEEMYELVDAIDSGDPDKICEEAGDVLMQAVFHTLMEEEKDNFNMTDMLSGLCEKLITRHTHVFGQDKASGADGALSVWDKNKMTEKHQTTFSDSVNDVPLCFPALLRAQKMCKRTEKGGWKFADFDGAAKKLSEEIAELKEAYLHGNGEEIAAALGDALLCMAWLGRAAGAECEQALADATKRMQKLYTAFETAVRADGKDVNALTDEEFARYYSAGKRNVEKS